MYYGKSSFMKGIVWAGNSEEAEKIVRENYVSRNILKIKIIKKNR
jgi:hypothetical protein